ncbi:MAG: DUF151 domain-containing protein [Flavobacteriales bacterium]
MEKVELRFLRITYSHTHAGAYALILGEVEGDRRLPIIVGAAEAQAIAIQVEHIKPARPMTHDLFKSLAESLDVRMKEVLISDLVEGIFHARLILEQDGDTIEIDARSSDAIALALRFGCPIFSFEFIMSAAGLTVEDEPEDSSEEEDREEGQLVKPIGNSSLDELKEMLDDALDQEDYERASQLRDEIKRREQSN